MKLLNRFSWNPFNFGIVNFEPNSNAYCIFLEILFSKGNSDLSELGSFVIWEISTQIIIGINILQFLLKLKWIFKEHFNKTTTFSVYRGGFELYRKRIILSIEFPPHIYDIGKWHFIFYSISDAILFLFILIRSTCT